MRQYQKKMRRRLLATALLVLTGTIASAQVVVKGNVYGGCEIGKVTVNPNVTNTGNTNVTINGGTVNHTVFGGGMGSAEDVTAGLVEGNTQVRMTGGQVRHSVYGGGELGSVGTYTADSTVTYTSEDANGNQSVNIPTACTSGTGVANVFISGGQVGIDSALMPHELTPGLDDYGYVFAGGMGLADSINNHLANGFAVTDSTYLEISGGLITASAYGGSENGLVLRNTYVKMTGGQLGLGHYKDSDGDHWDNIYDEETQWAPAIAAVRNGTLTSAIANQFHNCDHWPYDRSNYTIYDINAGASGYVSQGGSIEASNGHSFFGNVFGGGSGYYPIAAGIWRRSAGQVNGNTTVEIKGGHILTCVYGGNEYTDVKGKATVKMSGGTLGMPDMVEHIVDNPVVDMLFGGGMGDPRPMFSTWANVGAAEVEVTGGTIFGSIYGGGEDGHVLGDVTVTVNGNAHIGTWGYSSLDGNIFGAGRGFSGWTTTAGNVNGNTTINFKQGTMLGSIYGGGRLASVDGSATINISGGTIGNDHEAIYHTDFSQASVGGNVFGGSKGAIKKLNDTDVNPIWLDLAKVTQTNITINQDDGTTIIKGAVYGGGEFGSVTENTFITIEGGTIWRDVFGGGHGDDDANKYGLAYSPMERAGIVLGNTNIGVSGGWIKKCIYGGGELGSVGTIASCTANTNLTMSGESSWPYVFTYGSTATGKTTINVTGGRIGITGKDFMGPWDANGVPLIKLEGSNTYVAYDKTATGHIDALDNACADNGDIFGGSKGKAINPTNMPLLANVKNTQITVNYTSTTAEPATFKPVIADMDRPEIEHMTNCYESWSDWQTFIDRQAALHPGYGLQGCVTGAVYGGAEDGHVNEDTKITLKNGLVGHAIYGGGKGKGKFEGQYVRTAGKVFGNTEINIKGGYVVRSVFGGGNLASVGKGNYLIEGGETCTDETTLAAIAASGKATINFNNGQIGMLPVETLTNGILNPESVVKDKIPYGSVFGGCRGQVVSGTTDWFGFVNSTEINISDSTNALKPLLYGSVYGGGQDGHVRVQTDVNVSGGEIGVEFGSPTTALATLGDNDHTSSNWNTRGNIYGGGSGIGTYKSGNQQLYSPIAGEVYGNTKVTVSGGLIHRLVYGGGSLASVDGKATVTISSAIGNASNGFSDVKTYDYGGYVFGAGRGDLSVDLSTFATTGSTEVNLNTGAMVPGNVYGGGAMGQVEQSTDVNMNAGTVGTIAYDWKTSTTDHGKPCDTILHTSGGSVYGGGMGEKTHRDAGLVRGNTDVTISSGQVYMNVYGGGEVASVGQRDVTYSTTTPSQITGITPTDNTGLASVTIEGGQVGPAPNTATGYAIPTGVNGFDGYVFGGGKGIGDDPISTPNPYGQYFDLADVNATLVTVKIDPEAPIATNRIWGSVYGGAEDGHVLDSTKVVLQSGRIGTDGTSGYDGNIFGGGRNYNKKNYTAGRVGGNTIVEMTGGQNYGCIYGGGRFALTGVDHTGITMQDGAKHGNTNIRMTGGTVGNKNLIETFTLFSMGSVYGGGKGDIEGLDGHNAASALLIGMVKNTNVQISGTDTHVYGIVFGGGEVANVGKYQWDTDNAGNISNIRISEGLAKVSISGGTIGGDRAKMRYEPDPSYPIYPKYNDDLGYVYGGGEGLSEDPDGFDKIQEGTSVDTETSLVNLMATVNNTQVSISGGWVKGSVFGGAEAGHVRGNTKVIIKGGQIGAGDDGSEDKLYNDGINGTPNQFIDPLTQTVTTSLHGTTHWDFGQVVVTGENARTVYIPYDPVVMMNGTVPSDGKSWFGNVFGGGSGWFPYVTGTGTVADPYVSHWNPLCGKVWGNTEVIIADSIDGTTVVSRPHILNNVYGGNEATDVGGKSTVTISGGTVGVPRTNEDIAKQPCSGYVYGGGCGDPREVFNTLNNINETEVNITGGIIYGSVYGGAEDGHVLTDAKVAIDNGTIGTTGYSHYDGLVFGGGRGLTGENLTAGVVRDSAKLEIHGGTILGSVYGGGRLASVGTYLVSSSTDDNYGEMMADAGNVKHGHVIIDITGGTIGNDYESYYHYSDHTVGGNVFGGGMGRLDNIDGTTTTAATTNPQWHNMGRVKSTTIKIGQATGKKTTIKGNVFGGGELGIVGGEADQTTENHDATIEITGGTMWRDVYGGGYGSDETGKRVTYNNKQVSPMQLAARVMGNTNVTVKGGWIKKSIYGGGEMASVGRVTDSIKHTQSGATAHPFYLSWPYEFKYAANTGKATVDIQGGRIGVAGKDYLGPWNAQGKPIYYDTNGDPQEYVLTDNSSPETGGGVKALKAARKDNGDVYGGGKGRAGSTYVVAHMGNVKETVVKIKDDNTTADQLSYKPYNPYAAQIAAHTMSDKINYMIDPFRNLEDWTTYGALGCVTGAVYGGSEDGNVHEDTDITLDAGLIGHAIYGGGKGKGLADPNDPTSFVITSGKTYGNTNIEINGGYVVRNVFGGGNLASIGKGNYLGFGESTDNPTILNKATNSGKATVNVYGGTLGMLYPSKPDDVFKDNVPYGSVFGGSRGMAHQSTDLTEHRFGFVNETEVNIGQSVGNANDPLIYGSVYGGAQDGHVRRSTNVTVNYGVIGVAYGDPETATTTMGITDLDNYNWTERGNVFGGGSGLGTDDEDIVLGHDDFLDEARHARYAGSVFATTNVTVNGGTIHRNVYGGGNLAQVLGYENTTHAQTAGTNDKVTVTIQKNAKVGDQNDVYGHYHAPGVVANDSIYHYVYGGNVFGAGKGFATDDFKQYCNVINTQVNISSTTEANQGGNVYGDVYGGGENGHVLDSTDVNVHKGAKIGIFVVDTSDPNHSTFGGTTCFDGNVFGGGWGSGDTDATQNNEFRIFKHCGRVGGTTRVTMDGGTIQGTIFGGGRMAMVGVNENGLPYVNETEHSYDSVNTESGNKVKRGLATVKVSGTTTGTGDNITYNTSIGNPDGWKLLNGSDQSVGDIFGSGKGDVDYYQDILAGRVANTKIEITGSPRIYGAVFGGGEMASIGYWYEDGGKAKFYGNSGTAVVNVGGTAKIGTELEFTYDYAHHTNPEPSYWTVFGSDGKLIHTCTGNVCGGSQGDVDTIADHWASMGRSRRAYVTIGREGETEDNPIIMSRVFGGPEQGSMAGNAYVTINAGTIGTEANSDHAGSEYYFGGVYGGGYGSHNPIFNGTQMQSGQAIVNDSTTYLSNDLWTANHLAGRVYGNTYVNVLGGTIQGDVFGGASFAYVGGYQGSGTGNVYLNIGKKTSETTFVGDAEILGSVFGANNRAGTPYGNVEINIYATHHEGANFAPTMPITATDTVWTHTLLVANSEGNQPFTVPQEYALQEVFGGSNLASYTPYAGSRGTSGNKSTTVHVWSCDNTIKELYGGSNAADIGTTSVNTDVNIIVDGGRLKTVYGGGNGSLKDAQNNNIPANVWGWANTDIKAGVIDTVFGGGNQTGILLHTDLQFTHDSPMGCPEYIDEIFGGGNDAPIIGDVNTTLACGAGNYTNFYGGTNRADIYGNVNLSVYGGTVTNLFGGSCGDDNTAANIYRYPDVFNSTVYNSLPKQVADALVAYLSIPGNADLVGTGGNVTLNLFGGTITNAFGGSDAKGNIEGEIQVNVFNVGGDCALELTNLYGAGRNTPYEPNYTINANEQRLTPEVNVIHGTLAGSVFGGGYGAAATTEASPVVNMGYTTAMGSASVDGSLVKKLTDNFNANANAHPHSALPTNYLAQAEYVYGGGQLAKIKGNPIVNVNKSNTYVPMYLYGGGEGLDGDVDAAKVEGSTTVQINDGVIKRGVFGGGKMSIITGDTHVEMSGGQVGESLSGSIEGGLVYGGGQGAPSAVDEQGHLISGTENYGRVNGNTYVEIYGEAQILKEVYGGGQMGSVGNGNLTDNTTGVTHVTISGGQIGPFDADKKNANVYGGGQGYTSENNLEYYANHANVDSTSVIVCDSALINGNVFGGSANGHVLAGTRVLVQKGTNTKDKKPTIGTTGLSGEEGHVYGGGQGTTGSFTAGRVGGNTKVEISDGNIKGCVFGGGRMALTGVDVDGSFDTYVDSDGVYDTIHHGTTYVEITGGFIGNSDGDALLTSDQVSGNVYGAGRGDPDEHIEDDWGRVAKSVLTISGSPTIYGSVYGGGQMANVGHWLDYADRYAKGTSATTVDISGSPTIGTAKEFSQGFSTYAASHTEIKKTLYETIDGKRMLVHTRTGNVYGSGQGDVKLNSGGFPVGLEQGHCGKTFVNISETPTIMGSVFGGAEQGAVWGNTKVEISGGTIGTETNTDDDVSGTASTYANNYAFGSVFGGSYGMDAYLHLGVPTTTLERIVDSINGLAGRVYGNTRVIITGGTILENVYGGGDMASVGDTVMEKDGTVTLVDGKCTVNVGTSTTPSTAIIGPLDGTGLNGYVYGGGKGIGNDPDNLRKKYCNVHETEVTVNLTFDKPYDANGISRPDNWDKDTDGRIWGSIFGGGADGHTLGNAKVTLQSGLIGDDGTTSWDGNIFGGGRNFLLYNYTAGRVGGNVTVEMTGGHLLGSLYGGGRNAITGLGEDLNVDTETGVITTLQDGDDHGNITVMVKGGVIGNNQLTHLNAAEPLETVIDTFAYSSMGCVYGGGKGFASGIVGHTPESAMLISMVKNSDVQISQDPGKTTRVYGIVYGGGETASVGNCTWKQQVTAQGTTFTDIDMKDGTGLAKVTIAGGVIGGDRARMRYTLESDDPTDDKFWPKYNDDLGYVYGGGAGSADDPDKYPIVHTKNFGDLPLIDVMAAVNNTEVMIAGGLVKASVFGGSEAGVVLQNTQVILKGGQIGVGYGADADLPVYTDGINGTPNQFVNPAETEITTSLEGTYHWDFGKTYGGSVHYDPFDLVDIKKGIIPSDGKSWFGNVFGGGSGWFPYVKEVSAGVYECRWNPNAGKVWGDTEVIIADSIKNGVVVSRPHILNNVYGGNEMTDIGGKTLITMSGGTVGVPRTKDDIIHLPTLGYVFGGGCGDPRTVADNINNVDSTRVVISGGYIYGSVYGGAEDGHVLGDVRVTVNQEDNTTVIGCAGLSTADGNIFGGGRNYHGNNHKAGRVEGNVILNMKGGTALGSIYGGGRMALTGVNANGIFPNDPTNWPVASHGNVTINVSGTSTVIGNGRDQGIHLLCENDESVGDIFGSGKGDTKDYLDTVAGRVTNATITITGSPRINGAVFGGGEMASLGWWNKSTGVFYNDTGKATITIGTEGENDNPVIGTWLELDPEYLNDEFAITPGATPYTHSGWTMIQEVNGVKRLLHTCTGNVFGGCQGDVDFEGWVANNPDTWNNWPYMGRSRASEITVYGGTIMSSVFGGAEQGTLAGDTKVTIKGGTIGNVVTDSQNATYNFGDVYGAGYGSDESSEDEIVLTDVFGDRYRTDSLSGRVFGIVQVDILGGEMRNNVFGGGAFAYVGTDNDSDKGKATLNIGDDNHAGYDVIGNFYGGNNRKGSVIGDITVNVNNGTVKHDLFGGGNGRQTKTAGNVTVNFGEYRSSTSKDESHEIHVDYPIINGDLYGGSAYGSVNNESTDKNTVNLLNGNLNGDVYGGGLGDTVTLGSGHENIAALSYGQVEVNVGKASATDTVGMATFTGDIYGCNNINGTPKDNVYVNIYKTAHGIGAANNEFPFNVDWWSQSNALANNTLEQTYAIRSVYGGGNKASYLPAANKSTSVHVFTCVNTIKDVYGGGNAAHIGSENRTTNTNLEVDGGRIYRVFGGGNGEVHQANIYGTATTQVHGGIINEVFGGSNTNGTITTTALSIDSTGCDEFIGTIFGGGNNAIIFGDGELTIACGAGNFDEVYGGSNMADIGDPTHPSNVTLNVEGGVINKVFGGSKGRLADPANNITEKSANIYGNVTLNLKGGRIGNAFGGSNINGNIYGIITVNVLDKEDTDCPLYIDTIFGASNATPYTPNKIEVAGVEKTPISPVVNVKHIKNGHSISGCVFGGGNGNQAVVTANPKVTIGDPNDSSHVATIEENVYGGGNKAKVVGNTHVILDGTSTVDIKGNVYGAGHGAEVEGNAKVEVK